MKCVVRLALFLLICGTAFGEVRLSNVFSDHGVLQRDRPIHIWGFSAPNEKVEVNFHEQDLHTTATNLGLWEVYLLPEKAGGPYVLKVAGSLTEHPLERTDILVGDIWLASGQSNMEMPLQGWANAPIENAAREVQNADYNNLRLFTQRKRVALVPQFDTDDMWQVCTPETAGPFSAVAFFFGRKLMQDENVPIGLINASWGATPAQPWISQEGIAWALLPSVMTDGGRLTKEQGETNAVRENYKFQQTVPLPAGQTLSPLGPTRGDHEGSWLPSTAFNGMIAPFTGFTIKGWIWYQGETDSDTEEAHRSYSRVFPALIEDWRQQWRDETLPFLFAQLSSFETKSDWGCIRDAQRRTLQLANTGMAVTFDLGDPHNIHPARKREVGERLAHEALRIVYHRQDKHYSPEIAQISTEPGAIRVWLDHADGATTHDQPLDGFEIAGDDGRFAAAVASIQSIGGKTTVLLSSSSIPSPSKARYGWAPNMSHYLYNAEGLPLGTFSTERTCP